MLFRSIWEVIVGTNLIISVKSIGLVSCLFAFSMKSESSSQNKCVSISMRGNMTQWPATQRVRVCKRIGK